jgi:alpha-1,2-mannosyltransferase
MKRSGIAEQPEAAGGEAVVGGRRVGMLLTGGAVLVLAVMLVRWGQLLWDSLHNEAGRYDFSSYYAAAAALRADIHANIYDDALIGRVGIAAHTLVAPPLPYTYPPLFAILLSPFTEISFRVLSRAWLLGNFALWLVITLLLAREVALILGPRLRAALGVAKPERLTSRSLLVDPSPLLALALVALLSQQFAPAVQTLIIGQINFLVLLPLALVPELSRRGHERWVGAMIALAAMLKFTPAILILYLIVRRRWQAVFAALATLAALSLISIAVVGPGVFFAMVPQALRVGGHDTGLGHNEAPLASVLMALGASHAELIAPLRLVQYLLLGLLLLGTGYTLWRGPRSDGPRRSPEAETVGYALALCALVLNPAAWVHHYVWVLPSAVVAFGLAGASLLTARGREERIRAGLLTGIVVVACFGLTWGLPHNWDTEPSPPVDVYLGLPRAFWLELRPIATQALLLVLAYWYRHPIPLKARDMLNPARVSTGEESIPGAVGSP